MRSQISQTGLLAIARLTSRHRQRDNDARRANRKAASQRPFGDSVYLFVQVTAFAFRFLRQPAIVALL
jgi:hypothetical protein